MELHLNPDLNLPAAQGQWGANTIQGQGVFVDAEQRRWAGQFYNGAGPGLTYQL